MTLYIVARTDIGDLYASKVGSYQSAVDIAKKYPKAKIYESDGQGASLIWENGKSLVPRKGSWTAKSKAVQQTLF